MAHVAATQHTHTHTNTDSLTHTQKVKNPQTHNKKHTHSEACMDAFLDILVYAQMLKHVHPTQDQSTPGLWAKEP